MTEQTYDGVPLEELARENSRLKELLGGPDRWAIGVEVLNRQRARWVDEEARRRNAALGWQPPMPSGSLADELALPRATLQYRIGGLAGFGHNVLVAGPRKVGKSSLMVNLAAAASTAGRDHPGKFLGGTDVVLGGNVAYWNLEMDPDDLRDEFRRLPSWALDARRIKLLHLRGIPFPVVGNLVTREWVGQWLREQEVEVLIVDTWGALCAACGVRNLNDDAEVRTVLRALDELKRATWVQTVLVLIHMPHQTGEKHTERFKGAGATGDWADALWTYVMDEHGTRYLSATGRARIELTESALAWDSQTGLLTWGAGGSRAATARDRQRENIARALAEAAPDGLTAEALKNAAGGHRADATRIIARMEAEGMIEIEPRGRAKVHRLRQTQTG